MKKFNVYYTINGSNHQRYFLINAYNEAGARSKAEDNFRKMKSYAGVETKQYTITKIEIIQGFWV